MAISFTLTNEQEQLKQVARSFAREHLRPLMAAVSQETDPLQRALLLRPVLEKAVQAGFLKSLIPAPFGGMASSGVDAAIFIEELASESPDFMISMAGPLIALAPVYEVGTPERITRFVAPFLADKGAPLAAMAYSEPGGSANFDAEAPAEGVRTRAVLDGDEWVINGSKAWASHLGGWDGDGPDLMTIVCRTDKGVSLIVAEREHLRGHIDVDEYYDLPGLRGCLTTRVTLRDLRVPQGNLLGTEGDGVRLTRNAFQASGASIGTFSVAAMRQAFGIALRFAQAEKRGGLLPIIGHQAVADILADAKGKIEAVRLLSWSALDAVISGRPGASELALHAKIFGSETGLDVINDLIKAVGVTAYDTNFPMLRHLMDVLAYPIIEGGDVGVRRRQLQAMMSDPAYDPLAASELS